MTSQHSAMSGLFDDPAFFGAERFLWPLRREALSMLQQDFFNRRAKLADSLLRELCDGAHPLGLGHLPLMSSRFARMSDNNKDSSSTELHKEAQPPTENGDNLLVTLDARGYAPGDITVKLQGRSLAVVAMKQAGAEEAEYCSSSSSCSSFSSTASSQMGFAQKIDLPPHVDLSGLSCSLMDDGQLRIHAPVAKRPTNEEREVPIRFRTSLEFPITKDETQAPLAH